MLPPEPFKLSLTIKSSFDYDRVAARFRPYPSRGRPDRTGPVISLSVEPPEHFDTHQWRWNMHMASGRLSIVEVPDDFYEWIGEERYRFLTQKIREIGVGETVGIQPYR